MATTSPSLVVAGVPIYGIGDENDRGNLYWYFHQGAHNGAALWAHHGVRVPVADGWNEGRYVFKGDPTGRDGVLYRINSQGSLIWDRHLGHATGAQDWQGGIDVGRGWGAVRHAFGAGNGIIYAVEPDGNLYWYRHLGYQDGADRWANDGNRQKVGVGWADARRVFAGGQRSVYVVHKNSDLYWYQHIGQGDGTFEWANGGKAKRIGNGWNTDAFSGGDGIIYALKNNGDLYWYDHTGYVTGKPTWTAPNGSPIGSGWDEFVRII
jgi:hypothetical protein